MPNTTIVRAASSYGFKHVRTILAAVAVFGIAAALLISNSSEAATPASGTISELSPRVTWNGPIKAPTGSADCGGPDSASCDNFRLTIVPPSAAYGPFLVEIKLQPELAGDWDMQIYGPSGALADGSGNSPGQAEAVVLINPPAGTYTVAAAPFAPLANTNGNSYTASAEIKKHIVNGALQGPDTNITYQNFVAPGSMGSNAGEPTIGVNWNTGRAMYIAGLQTLRVTFDDTTIPSRATWEDKSAVFTSLLTMDPILFTDPKTGRTIVSQLVTPAAAQGLLVLTDGCSISGYTDDDGETWIVDQGCGLPSGADHQSVGGGPFAAPLPNELPVGYPHAVYYCAQSGVTAYCSRSDDGGLTYGPGVPIYITECGGLHGHPMVAPDGTVYVPNKACGGRQGMAVSEDNGLTWTVRTVPNTLPSSNDPGIGIGSRGTVYFGYQNGDGRPSVAVSRDKGRSWSPGVDVGAPYNIRNTVFPRVIAGDDDRAAFAFLGTPTAGPFQDANFQGEWHLYIASTFDGGAHWTTIDATPTDPVQRGCIWMQGGSNPCRNLLDFMGTAVDKQGRVLVAYADGCINCTSPSTSRSEKATIARQVNGRRLFSQYDPTGEPTPTPTPTPTPSPSPTPNPTPMPTPAPCGSPTSYPNDSEIEIGDNSSGNPYPSEINVAGLNGTITKLTVRLDGITHTFPDDVDLLLVGPSGQNVVIMSDVGGQVPANGVNLVLDDAATLALQDTGPLVSGTFKPANAGTGDLFIAPAPSSSGGSALSAFNGSNPNGTWRLYVMDDASGDSGAIGGWMLDITTTCGNPSPTPTPPPPSACSLPGIQVVTDAANDQNVSGGGEQDLLSVSFAEPPQSDGRNRLFVTMKMRGPVNPATLPPNTTWRTHFKHGAITWFVTLATNESSVVAFEYGQIDPTTGSNSTMGTADGGSVNADGTFVVNVSNSLVGSPTAGTTLSEIRGTVQRLVGAAGTGLLATIDRGPDAPLVGAAPYGDPYVLVGNASCGSATPTPTPTPSVTPTPTPSAAAPRYINYYPPSGMAEDFGEPSIGANWRTGNIMFFGGFSPYALRVKFDDSTSPASVTWDQTQLRLATGPRVAGDPILFTDRDTGRTFASQLFGLTPFNGMDFTDDDGTNYLPSQGSGIGSGIDHQTVGSGPFHAPIPTGATYAHAVYYCAQDGLNSGGNGIANCALSVDGGLTFGPAVPVYALGLNSCFPLHGHIKIAPDGTAYLPNRKCGAGAGLVLSEDNGITWSARTIPNSTVGDSDASIGIATDGTIFLGYEGSDGHARIATSHDKGLTWINHTDVGAQLGIENAIFPAVVAGDGNERGPDTARAAFAFYGSTSAGDQDDPGYRGNWYLFIASTFDDGKTWVTVNATPNDPMQRDGICTRGFQGCLVPRNLLDFFDATVDKEGRVLVGYQDGCMGDCVTGGPNLNTEKGVIARQSGGRRMFAIYDPVEPALPAAPLVTASVNSTGTAVQLSWPAPDSGGSPITNYKVYRKSGATGPYVFLASVTTTNYDDTTFNSSVETFYRVTAVNGIGEGLGVEVGTGTTASPCVFPGITVLNDVLTTGADDDAGQNTPPDGSVNVKQLSIAEPFMGVGANTLVFTLKVGSTALPVLPPNSQWFIVWNRITPDADFDRWYVAMRTDAAGTPSYEYGKFGVPLPPIPPSTVVEPNPNANTPVFIGAADSGTYNPSTGVITITLSRDKADNIQVGQSLAALNVRTYLNRPEPGQRSQNNASDITANGSYTLVGNASCQVTAAMRSNNDSNLATNVRSHVDTVPLQRLNPWRAWVVTGAIPRAIVRTVLTNRFPLIAG